MKRILLILALFVSVVINSCKAQDYIEWVGQSYTPITNGYLYNWYAVTDSKNIAPVGWHVPTYTELGNLATYLGGSSVAGSRLKESGTTYWNTPNTGAINDVYFNLRGSGYRSDLGAYSALYISTRLWTTYDGGTIGFQYESVYNDTYFQLVNRSKKYGFSVRLVADSGSPTSCIGNDGKVYETVTINGVTYTKYNIAETKYRDGTSIPEITDNTAWSLLVTGARCVYNNDESNK